MTRSMFPVVFAVLALAMPFGDATAQAVVQPLGLTDADRLAAAMRRLAVSPGDLAAVLEAAEWSLRLGDLSAAASLFARAEKIDPRNGRVKAGMGSILIRSERPGEALRYFRMAEELGAPPASYAADRGLAYDLIGEQERAQRDYRLALRTSPSSETVRRYALSLGISGRRELALAQLTPLLHQTDRAAWRARAFVLAMTGDTAGASRIATTMMPAGMATGLYPFFQRLPSLPPIDRAFAVHFGEVRATPERLADARLTPVLAALGPDPDAPRAVMAAAQVAPVRARRDRRGRRQDQPVPVQIAQQPTPVAQPLAQQAQPLSQRVQALPSRTDVVQVGQASPPPNPALGQPITLRPAAPRTLADGAVAQAPVLAGVQQAATIAPRSVIAARGDVAAVPSSGSTLVPRTVAVAPVAVAVPLASAATVSASVTSPGQASVPPRSTQTFVNNASPMIAPARMASSPGAEAIVSVSAVVTPPPGRASAGPQPSAAGLSVPVAAVPAVTPTISPAPSGVAATALVASNAPASDPVALPASAPTITSIALPPSAVSSETKDPAPASAGEDTILAKIIANLSIPAAELGVLGPARPDAAGVSQAPDGAPRAESTGPAGAAIEADGSRGAAASSPSAKAGRLARAGEGRGADRRGAVSTAQPAGTKRVPEDGTVANQVTRSRRSAAQVAPSTKKLGGKVALVDTAGEAGPGTRSGGRADTKSGDSRGSGRKATVADRAAADKEAPGRKVARDNPERIWVQVAGGASADDLPKAWAAAKAKDPASFAGRSGYTTPLRATNRVLAGPFKSDAEARRFVNQLAKKGVSAFAFTSESGQPVAKLPSE
jgi:Flp pilus assembly protein TadD